MKKEFKHIVFYDGECGFCQGIVQFVLRNDKRGSINFAPIQSEFTNIFFDNLNKPRPDLSTFYFYSKGKLLKKSSAALKLSLKLRFPFPLLSVFLIVPFFIRDFVYDIVAKNRFNFASKSCYIPTDEEKSRFIN